jgi:cytochrome b involved in lipid metabolism
MAPDPKARSRFENSEKSTDRLNQSVDKKSKRDDQKLITKIHDKYYDLTTFKHPGGPVALALVEGRDGTELFESHHIFTKKNMPDILSSYEITQKADTIESSNVFDWELTKNDPFTVELFETARKVIGSNIKASPQRWAEIIVLGSFYLS